MRILCNFCSSRVEVTDIEDIEILRQFFGRFVDKLDGKKAKNDYYSFSYLYYSGRLELSFL